MKRIPRRIFTEEFKCEVIKLVTAQGLTLAEASKNWTLPPNHYVFGWISKSVSSSSPALAHQSLRQIGSAFMSWNESWQSRRWGTTS